MLANPSREDLCQRIQASVERVVQIRDFSCVIDDEKLILRGNVQSRDDAMMCIVVARSVPGVEKVVSEIKVIS